MTICTVAEQVSPPPFPRHPMGNRARVLLTSVFGPYAQDDEFGSRTINPMELYHNQVTRVQGAFSLRMFHRSWGLMLMQANVSAPCTVLDFPTRERFIQEIRENDYDIIGIGSILPNILKVAEMCRLIRRYQPKATLLVGGHIANFPGLEQRIDADHIVRGEGVRWLRRFLGEDEDQPIRHPVVWSQNNQRTMGIRMPEDPRHRAAALIPSVGCPLGCNFCSTSAMFGGKGKFIDFYPTGDELYEVMLGLERELHTCSFFVMDENFLLHRARALRLLELMQRDGKAWALYVFSSANALKRYTMEQLVGLGISLVWMGLEGKDSQYAKLKTTDTRALVRELQANGIKVLGSSIIGLEEHTPANIDEAIEYAVSHDTDFHQFMLYTPVPGTALHEELSSQGVMLDESVIGLPDTHGQLRFNYQHPHIPRGDETDMLLRAFQRDFDVNGPSVLRIVRTDLAGWRKHRNHPERRIRERFARDVEGMATTMAPALWAARKWFRRNPEVAAKLDAILQDVYAEFGLKARLAAPTLGRVLLHLLKREQRRLEAGKTYEPPTFYERNFDSPNAALLQSVAATVAATT